jgi:hypothetical protein
VNGLTFDNNGGGFPLWAIYENVESLVEAGDDTTNLCQKGGGNAIFYIR